MLNMEESTFNNSALKELFPAHVIEDNPSGVVVVWAFVV